MSGLDRLGEFGLIAAIRSSFRSPDGVCGIGDDCAVIPQHGGMETLVSTDMLMEGTHFLIEDVDPEQLGWKSAAVNISDIAAMGGSPLGSFLAFALPPTLSQEWVDKFMAGFREAAEAYSFPLLGGDTTSSPDRLCICVTVLGQAPEGSSLKRSSARPGDGIFVTGTLGDSGCGLESILRGYDRDPYLVARHYRPTPRLAEGKLLLECGHVHAMMDISDGVGSDLRHIMEESGAGAEVDLDKLPISDCARRFCAAHSLDPVDMALCGGEDYELLFTADPSAELPVECTMIGRITEGGELLWKGSDKDYIGFRHF